MSVDEKLDAYMDSDRFERGIRLKIFVIGAAAEHLGFGEKVKQPIMMLFCEQQRASEDLKLENRCFILPYSVETSRFLRSSSSVQRNRHAN